MVMTLTCLPITSINMWLPDFMKTLTHINKLFLYWLTLILLLSTSGGLMADEIKYPALDPKLVKLHIDEPDRDSGYTVGDLLTRTITMEIQKPYKLIDTSLPIVGYEKRYRGQVTGIELYDIKKEVKETSTSTRYVLTLTYQVFTRNVVAKPATLPPEIVKVQSGKDIYEYRIPSWSFRISPIAVFGEVKLESDMSPFRGPLLKTDAREHLLLKLSLSILGLSTIGLLYIFGAYAWLPRMGGPFARAYRQLGKLRKLPADEETLKLGLGCVHQAFHKTLGSSAFGGNLDEFLEKKPVFAAIRPDIEQFFTLSRNVFFEPSASRQYGPEQHEWLRRFTRRCRDCERGLRPESQKL
jgi:mxaA protein